MKNNNFTVVFCSSAHLHAFTIFSRTMYRKQKPTEKKRGHDLKYIFTFLLVLTKQKLLITLWKYSTWCSVNYRNKYKYLFDTRCAIVLLPWTFQFYDRRCHIGLFPISINVFFFNFWMRLIIRPFIAAISIMIFQIHIVAGRFHPLLWPQKRDEIKEQKWLQFQFSIKRQEGFVDGIGRRRSELKRQLSTGGIQY